MFRNHKIKWVVPLVLIAVIFCVCAGAALAQDSDGVIWGAYQKNNGMLRIISDPSEATNAEEVISWNQTGPQGEQGPEGPQGEQGPVGPQGPEGPSQVGNWKFTSYYKKGAAGVYQTPTLFSLGGYYAEHAVLTVDTFITRYYGDEYIIGSTTYYISHNSGDDPSVVKTIKVYEDVSSDYDFYWNIDGVQISDDGDISYQVTANWGGVPNYIQLKFTYCVTK